MSYNPLTKNSVTTDSTALLSRTRHVLICVDLIKIDSFMYLHRWCENIQTTMKNCFELFGSSLADPRRNCSKPSA